MKDVRFRFTDGYTITLAKVSDSRTEAWYDAIAREEPFFIIRDEGGRYLVVPSNITFVEEKEHREWGF